ncbi:MAG: CPBP family intramembrane metalloprotease [Myxococcales bacterium]|nr:CPBP family intramembrane metalloprotease [Myxococcales bacterium]
MLSKIFTTDTGRLRNGWWIAIYLAMLAAGLFPTIMISARLHHDITMWEQGALILAATWLCQALRRRPITEVTGALDATWARQLALGAALGVGLMALPAASMLVFGWVSFSWTGAGFGGLALPILGMAGVAIAEELLFRGFIFQRVGAGLGEWPALLLLAALFLLTHLDNEGMRGPAASLAMVNIFVAGIMFGLAFLATRRLALPIGIHFGANVCEGNVLGFAVSGTGEPSLLIARPGEAPAWLTGGSVGIEGSLFGMVGVIVLTLAIAWYRKRATTKTSVA